MPTISLELFKMGDKKSFDYALEKMSCICGGIASPAYIDITYRFNDKVIVVKNVPVLRCENCEEIYSDALIEKRVEELAYKAMQEHKSFISFTDF
ncbi:MAG: YgiT-type zinc finger protein [Firmicutes bacterium]|nr:YgiT-type zinc finger protein [Bacillota bacterium]